MNILIRSALLIFATAIIINCSSEKKYEIIEQNGVKHYINKGIPASDYRPESELLFTISGPENVPDSMKGFGNIFDIVTDFNDNIYILDGDHGVIKKYLNNGEFDKYFPEQKSIRIDHLMYPEQMILLYDTILVYEKKSSKIVKTLTGGKFVNSQLIMDGFRPINFKSDTRNNMASFFSGKLVEDSVIYLSNDLYTLTGNFKKKTLIKEVKLEKNKDLFYPDLFTTYALKNGLFYVAENKGTDYRIDVINSRGNLQYVIEMDYKKIPYNKDELRHLNQFLTKMGAPALDSTDVYYKKPIIHLTVDKDEKLWCQTSVGRREDNYDSVYVDVFSKGIFQNRTALDFVSPGETYKLLGNRIYVISYDRKSLRVYDYR